MERSISSPDCAARGNHVVCQFADQFEQEPGGADHDADVAGGRDVFEQLFAGLAMHQMQHEGDAGQPDQYRQRSARSFNQRIIPDVFRACGDFFCVLQYTPGQEMHRKRGDEHQQQTDDFGTQVGHVVSLELI